MNIQYYIEIKLSNNKDRISNYSYRYNRNCDESRLNVSDVTK